jgi:TolA-binding protein
LAWALQNQGQTDQAIREYQTVTEETSTETAVKAQFMIGECYFAKKQHKEAVRHFLKAAFGYNHDEWTPLAYFEAARCFEVLKDIPHAINSYKAVIEKYPKHNKAVEAKRRLAALGGP